MKPDMDITIEDQAQDVLGRIQRIVDEELIVRAVNQFPAKPDTRNIAHAKRVILRHAQLQSVGNWIQSRVDRRLSKLEDELVSETRSIDPTEDEARTERLLAVADKSIHAAFDDIRKQVEKDAIGAAEIVAERAAKNLKDHHGIKAEAPELDHFSDVPVLGLTLQEHLSKLADDALVRFTAAIRAGVQAGDTLAQLVARIEGNGQSVTASEPVKADDATSFLIRLRLMDASEMSVNKVIQAALTMFANNAEQEVLEGSDEEDEDGEEVNMGWQWMAILDQATCPQCEFYDGNRWDSEFEPVDDSPEFPDEPPLHFNCRCSLVPSNLDDDPEKTPDFEHVLNGYTRKEKLEAFGEQAYTAFQRGDITANQLIGQRTNLLSLKAFGEAE
jgi:SPP1 gp7 family putative phage head morphogenesis protein